MADTAVDETKVKEALEDIRPALQADGGDLEFVGIEGKVVKVRLTGHCAGCPMAQMTLQRGVETRVKAAVPEVERVESVA
ncbi:MAG: NifU family protein [Planctomycetota bacterium]|jgi:Fe-S cluster biogenesis protein NfuA